MNHDVAHLLVLGRQFAAGDRPYVDWIDPNFPATHLTSLACSLVERWTGILSIRVFDVLVLLVVLLGCVCLSDGTAGPWPAAASVAAYLFTVCCPSVPAASDFGQRDHVFALVLLPWLGWRTGSVREPPAVCRWLTAALLGWWGTAKPMFLAVPLCVELARGRSAPPVRVSDVAFLVAGALLPFLLLGAVWPGSWGAFVTGILPLVSSARAHGSFMIPLIQCITRPQFVAAAGAGVILGALLWRARRRGLVTGAEARGWMAAWAAAGVVALIQRKGFAYHFIPMTGIAVLGIVRTAARLVDARAVACAAVLALAGGYRHFDAVGRWGRQDLTPLRTMTRPGATVLVCSTDVDYSWDAYVLSLRLTGPWGIHFSLAPLLADRDAGRRADEVAAYRARLAASVTASRPSVVLVREVTLTEGELLESVLVGGKGFLPARAFSRLASEEVQARFGGDGRWVAYVPRRRP